MEIRIRGDTVILEGYVAATARDSKPLAPVQTGAPEDSYEQITPGAFADAIQANPNVRFYFNHERDIGGLGENMELSEDAMGLRVRAETKDREVLNAAAAGKLTGWSWGMDILAEHQLERAADGTMRRTIDKMRLHEVSVLTREPASVATVVYARDAEGATKYIRTVEEAMTHIPDYNKLIALNERRKELTPWTF